MILNLFENVIIYVKPVLVGTLLLLFNITTSFAQTTISGRVLNKSDKEPVANASVFLSNTTVGGESAADGIFVLHNVRPGKYDLIISVVGFKTYNQIVVVNNERIELADIQIVPEVKTLKEVSIRFKSDPNRERNYLWFKQEFLGTSDLAMNCVITNPEVLDLIYDDNASVLTASSYDFLKIENKTLGYKLKYLVKNFVYDTGDKYKPKLHYDGSVLFEKMKGTPSQEKRWEKNRQEAYEGSEVHFLRAVINDKIEEEGFRVLQWAIYQNPDRPADSLIDAKITQFKNMKKQNSRYGDSLSFWQKKSRLTKVLQMLMNYPLQRNEILKLTDEEKVFALGCDMDALHITYRKDRDFPKRGQIFHLNDHDNKEVTVVNFSAPYTFFENNGNVLNVSSLAVSGAWSINRVAGLLPYDYESQPQ
ncbi:MAG: carboxypeptidase-like regulatory domain-containing protein [Mucilaginibacter sp.]